MDVSQNRVQKFDAAGGFLLKFGAIGAGDGQFLNPSDVEVDASDWIYVADTRNHRLQVFEPQELFSAFALTLRVRLDPGADDDEFSGKGEFSLGANHDGIDPLFEDVTIAIDALELTIPSGSFTSRKPGAFEFAGSVRGVALDVAITELKVQEGELPAFKLTLDGAGAGLDGIANPVRVSLIVGNDRGDLDAEVRIK